MKRVAIGFVSVVVLLAMAGGAFYGGMKFGQNQVIEDPAKYLQGTMGQGRIFGGQGGDFPVVSGNFPDFTGTPAAGQRGFARTAGGNFGTVQSVEDGVVTLSTQDGTLRVLTTDTTLVQKTMSVGVDALEAGEQVVVSGTTNDDGSITARSIQSMSGMQFGISDESTTQP
jgi:hypothetical protein